MFGDVIWILRPLDIGGSTDPTNDNGDYRIVVMHDPANTKLSMDLEQSLRTLDPMAKGDMRIMHRIEEP
jgi:hypothetical protein